MLSLMNNSKTFSIKNTFIIVAILMPIMLISAIGAGLSGLEGINPENHGKSLVFPIGNESARNVKQVFGYIIAPLSVLMVIFGGLNFKLKSALLNKSLLLLSLCFVFWLCFVSWALDARFVSTSDPAEGPVPAREEQSEDELHIRAINLN